MRLDTSTSTIALLSAMIAGAAQAADTTPANTTPANVNVLNLLSPFLSLNATPIGQRTLRTSLAQAIATNNGANGAQQALSISDKNLLGNAANTLGTTPIGTVTTFGVAANLAGGLPNQAPPAGSTVQPSQPVGAYGAQLGPIYVNDVAGGTTGRLGNVVTLLTTAYNNLTSPDLGVAKNYFANGAATNPSTRPPGYVPAPATAPTGYQLPRANGLPNTSNSVYDLAYGVLNTQSGQNSYGDSRPVQVRPSGINEFDPTALSGLATNPSFPSGHTTYAYTDGILLGMLTPSLYRSTVLRASEYANSRIVLGVHYPLDIIGGRSLASYDLAQAFSNPLYINNVATSGTAFSLPSLFNSAKTQLAAELSSRCGAAVATCAASASNTTNDPYVPSPRNAALYKQRLTYGLPTLSFAGAPREAAPAGGPDAAILLAPVYGGSSSAAHTIAPTGGIDGSLQTSTVDQIVVNSENKALAAFYGTALSYWSRINLYAAAGYFSNVEGTLVMSPTDRLTAPVTIGRTGTLYGNGATIAGNVTALSGATFGGGAPTAVATTTINGKLTLQPGSTYAVTAANGRTSSTTVRGAARIAGSTLRISGTGTTLPYAQVQVLQAAGGLSGTFAAVSTMGSSLNAFASYSGNTVGLTLDRTDVNFAVPGGSSNENRVAAALTSASRTVQTATAGALVNTIFLNEQASGDLGPATLDRIGGEGITAAQNAAFAQSEAFASSIEDEQNAWRSAGTAAPGAITLASPPPRGPLGYADASIPAGPILSAPQRAWHAWGGGFGGESTIDGVASLGTARQTADFYGGQVGLDYQVRPDLLIGAAAGGSSADFTVPDRSTSGTVTGGHGALYGAYGGLRGFYVDGSVTVSGFSNEVDRTAGGVGAVPGETERASFNSVEVRVRGEVGQRFAMNGLGFGSFGMTPFTALEYADLSAGSFTERGPEGGALALSVRGQNTDSLPIFAGLRLDGIVPMSGGLTARPFVQAAYVHEFEPTRNLIANLVSLPGASFLVEGARPAEDAAQVKVGFDVAVRPGVTLYANFDGEFSGVETVYAGKGGLRVSF